MLRGFFDEERYTEGASLHEHVCARWRMGWRQRVSRQCQILVMLRCGQLED